MQTTSLSINTKTVDIPFALSTGNRAIYCKRVNFCFLPQKSIQLERTLHPPAMPNSYDSQTIGASLCAAKTRSVKNGRACACAIWWTLVSGEETSTRIRKFVRI